MGPATRVRITWFKLGKSLQHVKPARELSDDTADLSVYFRRMLRDNAGAFDCTVELQGFAPVQIAFRPLCSTAALVALPSHNPLRDKVPDALCLLVNGMETPEDIAAVKAKADFPPEVWKALEESEKPVVVAVFNVNGRMRDPATTTTISVLANVYFNMFGTNAVADAR